MSTPVARRRLVSEMQAMSKALRTDIGRWRPDGGFGATRPKPELSTQEWITAGEMLADIAEQAAHLAAFAAQEARKVRATTTTAEEHDRG